MFALAGRRDALWKMFFQGDAQQQRPTVLPKVGERRIARSFVTEMNASRPVTFELLFYDHLFSDDKQVFCSTLLYSTLFYSYIAVSIL